MLNRLKAFFISLFKPQRVYKGFTDSSETVPKEVWDRVEKAFTRVEEAFKEIEEAVRDLNKKGE